MGETLGRVAGGARGPTAGVMAPKPGFVQLGQGPDAGIPHPPLLLLPDPLQHPPGIPKWANPKHDHLGRGCCRAGTKPVQIGADYHGVCCLLGVGKAHPQPLPTRGCLASPALRWGSWLLKSHAQHVAVRPRPRNHCGLAEIMGKLCWWDQREGTGSISGCCGERTGTPCLSFQGLQAGWQHRTNFLKNPKKETDT